MLDCWRQLCLTYNPNREWFTLSLAICSTPSSPSNVFLIINPTTCTGARQTSDGSQVTPTSPTALWQMAPPASSWVYVSSSFWHQEANPNQSPLTMKSLWFQFEGIPVHPHVGRFWEIIEKYRVTKFYTAPTAIRLLMKYGQEPLQKWVKDLELRPSVVWTEYLLSKSFC